jgi:hypothetical protein
MRRSPLAYAGPHDQSSDMLRIVRAEIVVVGNIGSNIRDNESEFRAVNL